MRGAGAALLAAALAAGAAPLAAQTAPALIDTAGPVAKNAAPGPTRTAPATAATAEADPAALTRTGPVSAVATALALAESSAPDAAAAPTAAPTAAASDGPTPRSAAAPDTTDPTGATATPLVEAARPPVHPAPHDIITVDQEALYLRSRWGQRVQADLTRRGAQIAAENDRIFAELSAEEAALTTQRASLAPELFRQRASDFDARVTRLRKEREAAARELALRAEVERQAFFRAAAPVIGGLMRARGATIALDPRMVLFSAESIDVTDNAVAGVDRDVGDGAGVVTDADLTAARAAGESPAEPAPLPGLSGPATAPPQAEPSAPPIRSDTPAAPPPVAYAQTLGLITPGSD